MKYVERMQKILDELEQANLPATKVRTKFILDRLQGEYIIKTSKKGKYYIEDTQYLGFLTFIVGLEFGKRKSAAKFKKEELPEVIKKLNGLKHFKLIKLKKRLYSLYTKKNNRILVPFERIPEGTNVYISPDDPYSIFIRLNTPSKSTLWYKSYLWVPIDTKLTNKKS